MVRKGDGTGLGAEGYSQVRKGDGTVLWNAIPDSVIEQFHALKSFGDSDEGTTTTSWEGQLGEYTLTGDSVSIVSDGINGKRALDFDTERMGTAINSISQPTTMIAIVEPYFDAGSLADGDDRWLGFPQDESGTERHEVFWRAANDRWEASAGTLFGGDGTSSPSIISAVFDGSNSKLRVDQVEATGDPGSNPLNALTIGRSGESTEMFVGIKEWHNGLPSNGLETRENELLAEYNILL